MVISVLQRIRRSTSAQPAGAFLTLLVLVFAFAIAGCPCTESVVNNNPQLRWWLFSNFGASRICPEMLKVGVALKVDPRSPSMGRFFPTTCSHTVDDPSQRVILSFAGTGYGYIEPAKRVGFSCSATIALKPDFLLSGDDIYVYGKMDRPLQGPDFRLGYIENPAINLASNLPPFGNIANFFGNQVLTSALTSGFTVVANEERGNDFSLGILTPPMKPAKPFRVIEGDQKFTFANETIDVHGNQRDYLGPFEVSSGQTLYMTYSLQGPSVDAMIVDKRTGDAWRELYQTGLPLGTAPGAVLGGGPINPGTMPTQRYNLAPGLYYVVIDNTAAAGLVAPPQMPLNPLYDPIARLSYVAQVGK